MREKGGWRCFMKDNGGQFVVTSGEILKPKLSASNSTSILLAKVMMYVHVPCCILTIRARRCHVNITHCMFYLTMQWC